MKPPITYQKLRGGYYTPKPITDFLAQWAIRSPRVKILEPSCGNGNFLNSAVEVFLQRGITKKAIPELLLGIEFDPSEARLAISRLNSIGIPITSKHVISGDFFRYCRKYLNEGTFFQAIIGNPPFIRYQGFPEDQRTIAFGLMESAGLHPTRMMNTWVPFLVGTTLLLADHGRLAIVIPAELLQVSYTAELRQFLSRSYSRITLVTFKRLLFDGVQQEILLFLGEKNGTERTGIRTIELKGIEDLKSYRDTDFSNDELKLLDHSSEKWTQYFLTKSEIDLLRYLKKSPKLTPLGDLANVDVGIVTGLNEFFVLTKKQVKEHGLGRYVLPIVCRSSHLQGILFSKTDWETNVENDYPTFLLNPPDVPREKLPNSLRIYVTNDGELKGANKGYKCRIRKRWYIVPSIWTPDAFMLRQIHNYPKIILNGTQATCTDTIHRVKFNSDTNPKLFTSAFLNSLTFAFSEVFGRSYGGGILELEPTEAEKLLLPLKGADRLDIERINDLVRSGSIDSVLDMTDAVLLREGLGLSEEDTAMLRGIWKKLRDRRNGRRHPNSQIDDHTNC